jgi:signal transduction histidine kinase
MVDEAALLDLMPAAVGQCHGPEHVFSYANSRLRAHAGLELVGLRFREAFPRQADGPLHAAMDRAFGAGETVTTDVGLVRPSFDAEGAVEGVMLYMEVSGDLDRRTLELDEREAALAARERAQATNDEILATLAHALRTPIHALMGYGTLLRAQLEANRAEAGNLLKLMGSAEVLGGLVERLLDLQAIADGSFELQPRPVPFGHLLEAAIARLRERAGKAGLHLTTEIPGALPLVFADERRMGQVLDTLLDNAVQFTPSGGTIVVRAREDGDNVACEIVDDGEGIEADVLPLVFTPFRAVPRGLRRGGGCGLGLPLGRAYMEAHGGRLWLESRRGHGTTGHVRLPIMGPVGAAP